MAAPEMFTMSCPCGASMEVDLAQGSQDTVCPECGQILEVVINVDKKTQRKQVGILVKPAALSPKKRVKAGAKVEEVHVAKCTCGAQMSIVPRTPDTIFTCTACQAEYTATLRQGKSGAVTALVLRPVLAMPVAAPPSPVKGSATAGKRIPTAAVAKPQAAKAAAPPVSATAGRLNTLAVGAGPKSAKAAPAEASPEAAKAAAAKENLLMMAKGDLGAQEVLMNEDVLTVACFCGKDLELPKMEFHRELVKCASCGLSYRVFAAKNPKNMATMAVMIPRKA